MTRDEVAERLRAQEGLAPEATEVLVGLVQEDFHTDDLEYRVLGEDPAQDDHFWIRIWATCGCLIEFEVGT